MAYNLDTSHDSPNFTKGSASKAVFGYDRRIEGITIHWWGDPNQNPQFTSVRDYLCRPNGNTSAHYVATGTGRQVACIVAPSDVAWHSGNSQGNALTIGIECDPRCRDEDYDVVAELVADIRSAYGDVPIYSHNMWSATSCPGNYDIDRIDRLSYQKVSHDEWGAVTDLNPKTPAPTTPVTNPTPPVPAPNPSPTSTNPDGTKQPDSGVPVSDKQDYAKENNELLKWLKEVIRQIAARFGINV
jgi:hypothetical protein